MIFDEHVVEQPAWATALVEVVREAMAPLGFIGHLGYRLWEPETIFNPFNGWMLAVFPTPYEWSGGSLDGGRAVSGFRLKISAIIDVFARVEEVVWSNPIHYNGELDGPEFLIQGDVLGKRVLLRVFHLPPPDEPMSHLVDPLRGEVRLRPEDDGCGGA